MTVANDPTDITTDIVSRTVEEDSTFQITDAEVSAVDEYYDNGTFTADDYYELYIDWENQDATGTVWMRVDGGAGSPFNTWNDSFNGADITFDTKTGAITWTPNNADVPDTLDHTGLYYRHEFRIIHYDSHGTTDIDDFFLTVENREPTLPAIPTWQLVEDDAVNYPDPADDWRWTMDDHWSTRTTKGSTERPTPLRSASTAEAVGPHGRLLTGPTAPTAARSSSTMPPARSSADHQRGRDSRRVG